MCDHAHKFTASASGLSVMTQPGWGNAGSGWGWGGVSVVKWGGV